MTPERRAYLLKWRAAHPEVGARWRAKNPGYSAAYWAENGAKYNDPKRHHDYYVSVAAKRARNYAFATEAKRLRAILL